MYKLDAENSMGWTAECHDCCPVGMFRVGCQGAGLRAVWEVTQHTPTDKRARTRRSTHHPGGPKKAHTKPFVFIQPHTHAPTHHMLTRSSSLAKLRSHPPSPCATRADIGSIEGCVGCATCPEGEQLVGCGGNQAGSCVACSAGMYKTIVGNWDTLCVGCSRCNTGAYRDNCGGSSLGSCPSCADGTYKTFDNTTGLWDKVGT